MKISNDFGKCLHKLMQETTPKTSQTKLAAAIGVKRQSIAQYLSGAVQPPLCTVIAIADFFHVSLDYLTGRSTVKSLDANLKMISTTTGLSENSILFLSKNKSYQPVVDKLLSSSQTEKFMNALIRYSDASASEFNTLAYGSSTKERKMVAYINNRLALLHSMEFRRILCEIFKAKKVDDYLWPTEEMQWYTPSEDETANFMKLYDTLDEQLHATMERIFEKEIEEKKRS